MTKNIVCKENDNIYCGKCQAVKGFMKFKEAVIDLKGHNLIVEQLKKQHVQELKDQKAKIRKLVFKIFTDWKINQITCNCLECQKTRYMIEERDRFLKEFEEL
jgi:hypothetical protein